MHLTHAVEQQQQKYRAECDERCAHAVPADGQLVVHIEAHDVDHAQLGQLGKHNAGSQAARERDQRDEQRLPEQYQRDVALAHAQHVVQAELAAAAAHEERVCVEQKQAGEHAYDDAAHPHQRRHRIAAAYADQYVAVMQECDDIKHHDHARAGEYIGQRHAPVLAQAVDGQLGIKADFHARSPPVASMVSVSEIF